MKLVHFLIAILLFSLLPACGGSQPAVTKALQLLPGQSLLSIYLSGSGTSDLPARVRLQSIAIEVDDVWIDLALEPTEVKYLQVKGGQLHLGTFLAPQGEHRNLRLKLTAGDGGVAVDKIVPLRLPEVLDLRAGESKCLFVDWNIAGEQEASKEIDGQFSAWGQRQVLGSELLYVACRDINTVYVVRMDRNRVVSSFSVPGRLTDMQVAKQERMLYLLSAGKRSVYVYDTQNSRFIDQIALPGGLAPEHLELSPDGDWAYVTDTAAGSLFKLSLSDREVVAQSHLGYAPGRLLHLGNGSDQLAIVLPRVQQVQIRSAEDLDLQQTISVGTKPRGVLDVDRALYVAESAANSVGVYDINSGSMTARISVGNKPESLVRVDERTIYVSSAAGRNLTELIAGHKSALRQILVGQDVGEMLFSQRNMLLYAAGVKSKKVAVFNRAAGKLTGSMAFGGQVVSLQLLE